MIWACLAALAAPGDEPTPQSGPVTEQVGAEEPTTESDDADVADPTPQVQSYEIPALESELPSALRTAPAGSVDDGSLDAALAELGMTAEDFERGTLVKGAWFVRPRLAFAQLLDGDGGPVAVRTGVTVGRRFWTVQILPIQLAADVGVRATAPIGGAIGRRVEGFANIGPWLGPVQVQLGLNLRWERERWHRRTTELADVLQLGPVLQAAFDARVFQARVGWMPMGKLWGPRLGAGTGDPVLPVIGHETTWIAGLNIPLGPVALGADVAWRDTSRGALLEVGVLAGLDLASMLRTGRSTTDEADPTDQGEQP